MNNNIENKKANDEFLTWLNEILKFWDSFPFIETEDYTQIKLLVQVREKYLQINYPTNLHIEENKIIENEK